MIEKALEKATDTKACIVKAGAINSIGELFGRHFKGAKSSIVICDPRTFAAAGEQVEALLKSAGVRVSKFVLEPDGKTFHADYFYVDQVREAIKSSAADGEVPVPVSVGSGVINDLTKRAAGELGVAYLSVATAASVDGYSSFGAALRSQEGAKQTYSCPAPKVIIADLDIMRTAPKWMTASGYADLLSKVPAGADWILAYELGASVWHDSAWHTVQDGLKEAIGNPEGVAAGDTTALTKFVEGLMLGGFAMQDMQSSRPASGAEHLFSHLLEMRNHTYKGEIVPHGIQVGVFTLLMSRVYEEILEFDYSKLDIEKCLENFLPLEEAVKKGAQVFAGTLFPTLGADTVKAKFVDKEATRKRLEDFKARWVEIREKLSRQLMPSKEIKRMLQIVGAPTSPAEIGSTDKATLSDAYKTIYMRDRYMALDFLALTGQLEEFVGKALQALQ